MVLGIVFILIGLLLPSLSVSRMSAERLACLAEMRSLGQSVSMYSADQKGYWPFSMVYDESEGRWSISFRDRILPVTGVDSPTEYWWLRQTWDAPMVDGYFDGDPASDVLFCPSDHETLEDAEEAAAAQGVNVHDTLVNLDRGMSMSLFYDPVFLAKDRDLPRLEDMHGTRADDVLFPSNKAVMYEMTDWHDEYPDSVNSQLPSADAGSTNVLAADGSAAYRARADATMPVGIVNLPPPYVYFPPNDPLRLATDAFNLTRDGVHGRDW